MRKIETYICMIFMLVTAVTLYLWVIVGNKNTKEVTDFTYNSGELDDVINNYNEKTLDFFLDTYDSNILVSPISVQNTFYNYNIENNTEDSNIMKCLDFNYKSWKESSKLFNYDCLDNIFVNENTSSSDIINAQISNKLDNKDIEVFEDSDIKSDSIISLFNLGITVDKNYSVSKKKIKIWGTLDYAETDDFICYRIPINEGKYYFYTIEFKDETNRVIDNFNDLSWSREKVLLSIPNIKMNVCGKPINILNLYRDDWSDYFDNILCSNSLYVKGSKQTYDNNLKYKRVTLNNITYIISSRDTGQFLAFGNIKL